MTYGPQSQEILVGARRSLQTFFAQKTQFQSGNPFVRPGALITITFDNEPYNLLFLHPKSKTDPWSFGLRDDVFSRVVRLKQTLEGLSAAGDARLIVCGDLNTMGLNYGKKAVIESGQEVSGLKERMEEAGFLLLRKSHQETWADRGGKFEAADLDHVLITAPVKMAAIKGADAGIYVAVDGWNRFPAKSQERESFIRNVSDHCSLFFEIEV